MRFSLCSNIQTIGGMQFSVFCLFTLLIASVDNLSLINTEQEKVFIRQLNDSVYLVKPLDRSLNEDATKQILTHWFLKSDTIRSFFKIPLNDQKSLNLEKRDLESNHIYKDKFESKRSFNDSFLTLIHTSPKKTGLPSNILSPKAQDPSRDEVDVNYLVKILRNKTISSLQENISEDTDLPITVNPATELTVIEQEDYSTVAEPEGFLDLSSPESFYLSSDSSKLITTLISNLVAAEFVNVGNEEEIDKGGINNHSSIPRSEGSTQYFTGVTPWNEATKETVTEPKVNVINQLSQEEPDESQPFSSIGMPIPTLHSQQEWSYKFLPTNVSPISSETPILADSIGSQPISIPTTTTTTTQNYINNSTPPTFAISINTSSPSSIIILTPTLLNATRTSTIDTSSSMITVGFMHEPSKTNKDSSNIEVTTTEKSLVEISAVKIVPIVQREYILLVVGIFLTCFGVVLIVGYFVFICVYQKKKKVTPNAVEMRSSRLFDDV